jgi:hypothetical protein
MRQSSGPMPHGYSEREWLNAESGKNLELG